MHATMMKRRRDGGESETGRGYRVANAPTKKKQKNGKKLGGGGLSLSAFADAKSKPRINPAQIREHREFYQNAKKVQKYKKLVKQLGGQSQGLPQFEKAADKPDKQQDSNGPINYSPSKKKDAENFVRIKRPFAKTDGKQFKNHPKQQYEQKNTSQMERMREEYEKEKLDKEEKRKEKQELYAEQQEARERAQRGRKELQLRLRKRTQRGQPLIKHRMERLLETIQRG